MSEEYTQISAFLRPDQIRALDDLARSKGIHGRQPLLRWAVDAYLLAETSIYRTQQHIEPEPADAAA